MILCVRLTFIENMAKIRWLCFNETYSIVNLRKWLVNTAVKEAARHANHEIVNYLVLNHNEKIDRQVECPLHHAVAGQ